jgi:hypothetical protein
MKKQDQTQWYTFQHSDGTAELRGGSPEWSQTFTGPKAIVVASDMADRHNAERVDK